MDIPASRIEQAKKESDEEFQKARVMGEPLVKLIEETINGIDAATALVNSFYDDEQGGAQKELFAELEALENRLAEMDSQRNILAPFGDLIPLDLIDHIDRVENCNPDLYTRFKVDFLLEERLRLNRIVTDFQTVKNTIDENVQK